MSEEYDGPWRKITCVEREALIDSLGRSYNGFNDESGVKVLAASTDPERYILTEWGYDYDRPVLRDERWPRDIGVDGCAHHVPAPAKDRCPHCGVICPDPDVERWLTEHRPVCTVKPT